MEPPSVTWLAGTHPRDLEDLMIAHGVVLIVEDEPLIRMLGVDMIQEAGFNVLEAGTVAEALEILQDGEEIDCVFTDVNLPGELSGLDLAEMIYQRWPHIHVIITTGDPRRVSGNLMHSSNFVPKPYNFDDISKALGICS